MSFTTPNGTYGARQPSGNRFMRWVMARTVKSVRKGGKFMGMNALVLVTTGKKTGLTRETPLGYWSEPAGSWLVCASAAGGPRNPAWYWNLAAAPDAARVVVGGREYPVRAEELHGPERGAAWAQITAAAPRFGAYQTKTDRVLPIIRLTPIAG